MWETGTVCAPSWPHLQCIPVYTAWQVTSMELYTAVDWGGHCTSAVVVDYVRLPELVSHELRARYTATQWWGMIAARGQCKPGFCSCCYFTEITLTFYHVLSERLVPMNVVHNFSLSLLENPFQLDRLGWLCDVYFHNLSPPSLCENLHN